jgi:hypothetical protein
MPAGQTNFSRQLLYASLSEKAKTKHILFSYALPGTRPVSEIKQWFRAGSQ